MSPNMGDDPCSGCDSTRVQVAGMRAVEHVGTGNQGETFAAFLAVVSSPLARHIAPMNDDLAPEVGLSWSRSSGLVTAGAGEAPSGLWRRVLLERAAAGWSPAV